MQSKIVAIIPAAGAGTRLGEALPKQYLPLGGMPLMAHTLEALAQVERVDRIVVVLSPGDVHWPQVHQRFAHWGNRLEVVYKGGKTRGESVVNGLSHLRDQLGDDDWVMVHDAARPCIRAEWVNRLIDAVIDDPVGGLLALPLSDTIKQQDNAQRVERTVPREGIWRAQTPQMFRFDLLHTALQRFTDATDEAQAIEAAGHRPKLVMGDACNLKVTFATDLLLAETLLK